MKIITDKNSLFINRLYYRIAPMKKYNGNSVFLLSIHIFLILNSFDKVVKLLEKL
jgi:hypothetical protein